jgi:hypothetical protein
MHTSVKKVIHFTDGAASQYKNCKNFTIIYFFINKISGLRESGIFLLRVMAKGHAMALVGPLRNYQEELAFKMK